MATARTTGGPLGVPVGPDGMWIRTAGPVAPLLATFREMTGASTVGGIITLLLAPIGWYTVVALAVNQRQKENMPLIASAVALAVIVVVSHASWIAAHRAAGADPFVALRDG